MTARLSHRVQRRLPIALLRLAGELDRAGEASLRLALADALAAEPTSAVVDLSGFSLAHPDLFPMFADAALDAQRWSGAQLLLCHPTSALREGLRRHGLDRRLPVYGSTAAALRKAATEPVPPRVHRRLAPTRYAPRAAREVVARACARWEVPHAATAAQIVCSELVTNAVRHAGTTIDLTVTLRDDQLRVSVRDRFTTPARLRTPGMTDDSGRGLLIVDTVASAWGNAPVPHGKLVWAALSLATRPGSARVGAR